MDNDAMKECGIVTAPMEAITSSSRQQGANMHEDTSVHINASKVVMDVVTLKTSDTENHYLSNYERAENILITQVQISICAFGVFGNLLTLFVLTRRRWQHYHRRSRLNDNRAAESDILGLISLALSDLLFCISILPHAGTYIRQFAHESLNFYLYYSIYENAIINTFVMLSTWLTVTITLNRYMNLCHSMVALRHTGPRVMKKLLVIVTVFCIVFNLPRFFNSQIDTICLQGKIKYFPVNGPVKRSPVFEAVFNWTYFAVGICMPLTILAYCNFRIIRAVYSSFGVDQRQGGGRNIITRTLIAIIIVYLILVSPGEIIKFFKENVISTENTHLALYNLTVTIANTLQALNFACNFIPYLLLDKHFRRTIRFLLPCTGERSALARFESISRVRNGMPMNFMGGSSRNDMSMTTDLAGSSGCCKSKLCSISSGSSCPESLEGSNFA